MSKVYFCTIRFRDNGSETEVLMSEFNDVPKGYEEDDIFWFGLDTPAGLSDEEILNLPAEAFKDDFAGEDFQLISINEIVYTNDEEKLKKEFWVKEYLYRPVTIYYDREEQVPDTLTLDGFREIYANPNYFFSSSDDEDEIMSKEGICFQYTEEVLDETEVDWEGNNPLLDEDDAPLPYSLKHSEESVIRQNIRKKHNLFIKQYGEGSFSLEDMESYGYMYDEDEEMMPLSREEAYRFSLIGCEVKALKRDNTNVETSTEEIAGSDGIMFGIKKDSFLEIALGDYLIKNWKDDICYYFENSCSLEENSDALLSLWRELEDLDCEYIEELKESL